MKKLALLFYFSFLITSKINASVTVENLSNGEIVTIQNSQYLDTPGGDPNYSNWVPPVYSLSFAGGDSLKITWDWWNIQSAPHEFYIYQANLSYKSYEEPTYEDYISRFWNTYANNTTYYSGIGVGITGIEFYSSNLLGNMTEHNIPSFFHIFQVPNEMQQLDVSIFHRFTTTEYFPGGDMYLWPTGPDNTAPYDVYVIGSQIITQDGPSSSSDRFTLVPEPSSLSLLAVGLGGLAILRRRRS